MALSDDEDGAMPFDESWLAGEDGMGLVGEMLGYGGNGGAVHPLFDLARAEAESLALAGPTPPKHPPASPGDIAKLPTRTATAADTAAGGAAETANAAALTLTPQRDSACAVCLESYEAGCVLKTLPCGHEFHVACIDAWLETSAICPVCRKLPLTPPAAGGAGAADDDGAKPPQTAAAAAGAASDASAPADSGRDRGDAATAATAATAVTAATATAGFATPTHRSRGRAGRTARNN